MRNTTICSSDCAAPHIIEVMVKPTRQAMNRCLRPNRAASQPTGAVMIADGDDVGGQHPGDLVERRGQAALHVRQRHVGDRGIQHLHERGRHHASRDQRAMADRLLHSGSFAARAFPRHASTNARKGSGSKCNGSSWV